MATAEANEGITVFQDPGDGLAHVRVDRPGVAAVSRPITDPLEHIKDVAFHSDLEIDDTEDDRLVITIPAEA